MPILDDLHMSDDYFEVMECTELLRSDLVDGASFGVEIAKRDGSVTRFDFAFGTRPNSDFEACRSAPDEPDGECSGNGDAFVFFVRLADENEDDPNRAIEMTVPAGNDWWVAWKTIVDLRRGGEDAVRVWLNLPQNQPLKEFIEEEISPIWLEETL